MPLDEGKREIAVQTASVTIRTMVVGKRQFTIAMLKQLPNGIIGPSCDVWGYVRYPLGQSLFHLIYVLRGELMRMSVRSLMPTRLFKEFEDRGLYLNGDERTMLADTIKKAEQLFIAV